MHKHAGVLHLTKNDMYSTRNVCVHMVHIIAATHTSNTFDANQNKCAVGTQPPQHNQGLLASIMLSPTLQQEIICDFACRTHDMPQEYMQNYSMHGELYK